MRRLLPTLLLLYFALVSGRAPNAHAQPLAPLYDLPSPWVDSYTVTSGGMLAFVGDLDGDGVSDVIAGAPGSSAPGHPEASGRANVYSGASGQRLRTLVSPYEEAHGRFGAVVDGGGDVDGDGTPDLLVGAYWEDATEDTGGKHGRVHVFSGATGAVLHSLTAPSRTVNGQFGFSVAGVGDLDEDGHADLAAGAIFESMHEGRVHLYGGADGLLIRTLAAPEPQLNGLFGYRVASVGDANGDGIGDVLVGEPGRDRSDGVQSVGAAYLFSGADGTLLHALSSPHPQANGNFGIALEGLGDLDGDGRADHAVASWLEKTEAGAFGRVYVFSGDDGALLYTLTSPLAEAGASEFGRAIARAGDLDRDGVPDVLVGAFYEDLDQNGDGRGRAYVFSGASGTLIHALEAPAGSVRGFGLAVAGGDDLDGDGGGDVLVGAWDRTYAFSGSKTVADEIAPASPKTFSLEAAYPNPFAGQTTLTFTLAEPGPVRLALYDALGREVQVLADGTRAAGRHVLRLDGLGLVSGLYLVRLVQGGASATRSLMLSR